MNTMPNLGNIFLSCGMSENDYKSVRKKAYAANVNSWKYLSALIAVFSIAMIIVTLATPQFPANIMIYIFGAAASVITTILLFFVFKPSSAIAQVFIYIDLSAMLVLGMSLSLESSTMMAVTFIAILLVMPMFVVNRPIFNALLVVLSGALHIYLSLNYKDPCTHQGDFSNTIIFGVLSIVIGCIYSSLRFREFRLQQQIEEDRDTDGITGLANKDALMRRINEYLASGGKGVMMAIDIDNFKAINDNYGHVAGDIVLSAFGKTLFSFANEDDICGRFGGDEFILLMKNIDVAKAEDIAEKIIQAVSRIVRTPNKNDVVTFSAGLADIEGNEEDYDDIFHKADTALYAAKANGKNCSRVYHKDAS